MSRYIASSAIAYVSLSVRGGRIRYHGRRLSVISSSSVPERLRIYFSERCSSRQSRGDSKARILSCLSLTSRSQKTHFHLSFTHAWDGRETYGHRVASYNDYILCNEPRTQFTDDKHREHSNRNTAQETMVWAVSAYAMKKNPIATSMPRQVSQDHLNSGEASTKRGTKTPSLNQQDQTSSEKEPQCHITSCLSQPVGFIC